MLDDSYLNWLSEIDTKIVRAALDIKVLSRLSWGKDVQQAFLESVNRGNPQLPEPSYAKTDLTAKKAQLAACMTELDSQLGRDQEPLARFLFDTAHSYHELCLLLDNVGTPAMMTHSLTLYGEPKNSISSGQINNLEAAQHFLTVTDDYRQATNSNEMDYCLSAEAMASEIRPLLEEVFEPGLVRVEIDPNMASKAAAGATRIRLRPGTCFSEYDLGQLLQHEGFVHSLTALNGARQSRFQCLSLGAPRTTGAQEGLATFAELVSGVMDINRLERLALRVVGIDHALSGADFIEVYRFFISSGQSELESFNSSMRIFRGVPVTGGYAFTKDVVYLHGLMEVHTFFCWAMQHKKLDLALNFFAGRMTVGDLVRLESLFKDGLLDPPVYLPPWMKRTSGLAGYLAFSVFSKKISVEDLDENHIF